MVFSSVVQGGQHIGSVPGYAPATIIKPIPDVKIGNYGMLWQDHHAILMRGELPDRVHFRLVSSHRYARLNG